MTNQPIGSTTDFIVGSTNYDFPKTCKHNKSGWCHLCVIKELSQQKSELIEELEWLKLKIMDEHNHTLVGLQAHYLKCVDQFLAKLRGEK
jgi:hypothetical protein